MEIKDLRRTEYFHNPELAFANDLPDTIGAVTIGWLGEEVPREGVIDPVLVAALEHARDHCYVDQGLMGVHTCEICDTFSDRGEILIAIGDKNYVLPRMVLHYIEAHRYLPPAEFVKDLEEWWATLKT